MKDIIPAEDASMKTHLATPILVMNAYMDRITGEIFGNWQRISETSRTTFSLGGLIMVKVVKCTVEKPDGVWRKGIRLELYTGEQGDAHMRITDENDDVSYDIDYDEVLGGTDGHEWLIFSKNCMCWGNRDGENEALFAAIKSYTGHLINYNTFTPLSDIMKSLGMLIPHIMYYTEGWKRGAKFDMQWKKITDDSYELYFDGLTII